MFWLINIAIIDPTPLPFELSEIFKIKDGEYNLVATSSTPEEITSHLKESKLDLVFFNSSLVTPKHITTLQNLIEAHQKIKFVAYCISENKSTTKLLSKIGIHGLIKRDASSAEYIFAAKEIKEGNFYTSQSLLVSKSNPESELQEVYNKLGALTKAIELAEEI